MARDQVDMTPIETRDELVAWFEEGSKPKSQFRIGTEHEKFVFTVDGHRPVPYDGRRSIRALLEGMQHLLGWEPIVEDGNIIGLFDVTGGGAISLEPGGQFELSGAPVETVHQTCSELMAHLAQVKEVARPLGIGFLGLGMTPNWTRAEMPTMPKGRYRIMTAYMPKVGKLRPRHDVPHLHGADQSRLLLRSRHGEEAAGIARAAAGRHRDVRQFAVHRRQAERLSVVPLGDLARHRSRPHRHAAVGVRAAAWGSSAMSTMRSTCRCISSSAAISYIDVAGQSFRDLMAGKLAALPGERATISDWANHISTIFPEVRLKRYLEMRGADGGPWRRLPALPAFWAGILYDDDSLDAAWDLVKDWTAEERQTLRDDVPKLGFAATIARPHRAATRAGHARDSRKRGSRGGGGWTPAATTKSRYLRPIQEYVARGITPAEELLDKFHGPWDGSVEPVFKEYAY